MVTSTRPRERRELIRFLIAGSRAASSEPARRWMSRNRLLTVFRSTETEKSSPVIVPLPYPVIDFIVLYCVLSALYFVLLVSVVSYDNKVPATKLNQCWKSPNPLHRQIVVRTAFGTVHRGPAVPCEFLFL